MAAFAGRRDDPSVDRSVARYRRLLILYPAAFRAEFGDDLLQGYRDLLVFSAPRRRLGTRIWRDLLASATRERVRALWPDGGPSLTSLLALAALVLVLVVVGSPGVMLVPGLVFVALPLFGISRLADAWTARRAGAGGATRSASIGVVSFAPAIAGLVWLGSDAGYWIFVAVSASAIVTASFGLAWAVFHLVRRQSANSTRRRAALVLVPSVAVLAFIIGASVNSYRNSLGPPGDHSVANASETTRALWIAANDGDVAEVVRLIETTCADPWVKFPYGNGRHNAKGQAETRALELPDVLDDPYEEIAGRLGDAMDDWDERCGASR